MADNKKYYYMRLKENFFETEEMVMLEAMPDGILYSNILLKLYLKSLKNEGRLMFKDTIPYNAQMIATVTRHQIGTVEKALSIFKELGLIEVLDNGVIYMNDIQLFIGQASTEAERKKKARLQIEAEKMMLTGQMADKSGQMSDKCPPEIRDKSIENRDKNINNKTSRLKYEISDMNHAKLLFELMRLNNETAKEPNFENWANEFRLMRERDQRTNEQIEFLIRWTQQHHFWLTNILSPAKLRKQWDKLVLQVKAEKEGGKGGKIKSSSETSEPTYRAEQNNFSL